MVSLEKPLEAGAWTSNTSTSVPSPNFDDNHLVRMAATWSGSRWSMSGTVPECIEGEPSQRERIACAGVIIVVDLAGRRVELTQPDDFKGFSVRVLGDPTHSTLGDVVHETG